MNQSKHFNLVIKQNAVNVVPLLPPEYQQVEYIEGRGEQYLNIGDLSRRQYYEIDFEWVGFINNYIGNHYNLNGLLGINNYGGSGVADVKLWLSKNNTVSGTIGTTSIGQAPITTGVKYTLYFSNSSFLLDGQDYTSGTVGAISGNISCYVGSVNMSNMPSTVAGSAVKIYRLKTNCDEMYPCYRKSDNKPGMYDLVTSTFFTNVGYGEFTVGADV